MSKELLHNAKELINDLRIKKYSAILYQHGGSWDDDEADLLIISEELPSNTERRQVLIYDVSYNYLDIEVIGWTYDEYKKRRKKAEAFIHKILQNAIIIKDDYEIFGKNGKSGNGVKELAEAEAGANV